MPRTIKNKIKRKWHLIMRNAPKNSLRLHITLIHPPFSPLASSAIMSKRLNFLIILHSNCVYNDQCNNRNRCTYRNPISSTIFISHHRKRLNQTAMYKFHLQSMCQRLGLSKLIIPYLVFVRIVSRLIDCLHTNHKRMQFHIICSSLLLI